MKLPLSLAFVLLGLVTGGRSLNCDCDDGENCKESKCEANKNWYGQSHCQLRYDTTINGPSPWRGCALGDSRCDIVAEPQSLEATFQQGHMTSFGGCCSDGDGCQSGLNQTLEQTKATVCPWVMPMAADSFGCACTQDDMLSLFDLSAELGVQWMPSFTVSNGNFDFRNATDLYAQMLQTRRQMSELCIESRCQFGQTASQGVQPPPNAQPVCAQLLSARDGKTLRGCMFLPKTQTSDGAGLHNLHAEYPSNPTAADYDARLAVNASARFSFIFECRSDMCNQPAHTQILSECTPGATVATPSEALIEIPTPPVFPVTGGSAETTVAGTTVGGAETTTTAAAGGGVEPTVVVVLNSTGETTAAGTTAVGGAETTAAGSAAVTETTVAGVTGGAETTATGGVESTIAVVVLNTSSETTAAGTGSGVAETTVAAGTVTGETTVAVVANVTGETTAAGNVASGETTVAGTTVAGGGAETTTASGTATSDLVLIVSTVAGGEPVTTGQVTGAGNETQVTMVVPAVVVTGQSSEVTGGETQVTGAETTGVSGQTTTPAGAAGGAETTVAGSLATLVVVSEVTGGANGGNVTTVAAVSGEVTEQTTGAAGATGEASTAAGTAIVEVTTMGNGVTGEANVTVSVVTEAFGSTSASPVDANAVADRQHDHGSGAITSRCQSPLIALAVVLSGYVLSRFV